MSEFSKRLGLFFAAGVVSLLLIFQMVFQTEDFIVHLERKAEKKEQIFQEVSVLSARLQDATDRAKGEKGGGDTIVSLLPWLEKETAPARFAGHVREIAPMALQGSDSGLYREKATLGISQISMESALRFLHQLESAVGIRIVRGDLKRSEKEKGGVALSMEIGLL